MQACKEVASKPMVPDQPMGFTLVRVPFFLEPDYPTDTSFEETNRVRLVRKWGGQEGWERQKRSHRLKERGQEVGIERFDPHSRATQPSHTADPHS